MRDSEEKASVIHASRVELNSQAVRRVAESMHHALRQQEHGDYMKEEEERRGKKVG